MDTIEADDGVGAIVVTGAATGILCGRESRQPARVQRAQPRQHLRGLSAHCPQPAADSCRGQRCRRRRGDEPGARLRRAPGRPSGTVRHPLSCRSGSTQVGGTRGCSGASPARRAAMAAVIFGEVFDGAEAERIGLVHRCVDDDELLDVAQRDGRASGQRTTRAGHRHQAHDPGDGRHRRSSGGGASANLDPQVWSTRQPWFAERVAALQQKISSKKP